MIAGAAQRHIIRRVSRGTSHFLNQGLNGIVVGIFAALVRKLPIICATLVLILCAKDVLRMLIMYVYEETKDFVERA